MATILLTGHTGYLGSRVAACLQRHAVAFAVLPGRLHDIAPHSLPYRTVIHCAGKTSGSGLPDLEAANVLGTQQLIDGLAQDARIIHVSSRKVYPPLANQSLDEGHLAAPWDAYGRSKLAAEQAIQRSGHACIVFRCGALFGHPAQSRKFPDFAVNAALAGTGVALATPPRAEDYLDVEWFAELVVRACADGPHWGQVFNVSGPVRSLDGMLDALSRACLAIRGRPVTITRQPMPIPRFPWLDTRKLQAFFPGAHQMDDQDIFERMLTARLPT